jgi:hypothetical protein
MDIKGRNLGTFDNMHHNAETEAYLARDKRNDCESELTANQYNRIFHRIIKKIKDFFKRF